MPSAIPLLSHGWLASATAKPRKPERRWGRQRGDAPCSERRSNAVDRHAQNAAAPRVGELKVDLTWPFDPSRIRQTWGRHTRHSERMVELRMIPTEPYEQCNETLGPPTASGETEEPICEEEFAQRCFRNREDAHPQEAEPRPVNQAAGKLNRLLTPR